LCQDKKVIGVLGQRPNLKEIIIKIPETGSESKTYLQGKMGEGGIEV
jgi:hypothetical protein